MPYYITRTETHVSESEAAPTLIAELLRVEGVRGVTVHMREGIEDYDVRYDHFPTPDERRPRLVNGDQS